MNAEKHPENLSFPIAPRETDQGISRKRENLKETVVTGFKLLMNRPSWLVRSGMWCWWNVAPLSPSLDCRVCTQDGLCTFKGHLTKHSDRIRGCQRPSLPVLFPKGHAVLTEALGCFWKYNLSWAQGSHTGTTVGGVRAKSSAIEPRRKINSVPSATYDGIS